MSLRGYGWGFGPQKVVLSGGGRVFRRWGEGYEEEVRAWEQALEGATGTPISSPHPYSAFRLPWNDQVPCTDTLPTVICCLSIGKLTGPSNCGLKPLRLPVKEKILLNFGCAINMSGSSHVPSLRAYFLLLSKYLPLIWVLVLCISLRFLKCNDRVVLSLVSYYPVGCLR